MFESSNNPSDIINKTDIYFPESFDALDKCWGELSETQKTAALSRLWEAKKEVVGTDGEKIGYNRGEFIRVASKIISESKERIREILDKHLHSLSEASISDNHTESFKQIIIGGNRSEKRKNKPDNGANGKERQPRQKPEEPKAVVLTPEQIREINKAFRKRDKIKKLIRPVETSSR